MKKYRKFFPTAMRREIATKLKDGEMVCALAREFETSEYRIRKIRSGAGIPTMRCRGLTLSMRERIAADPRSSAAVAAEFNVNVKTVMKLQKAFQAKAGQPDAAEACTALVRRILEQNFGGEFAWPIEGDAAFTAALLAAARVSVPDFQFQSQVTLDLFAAGIARAVTSLRVQQGHTAWLN